MRLCALIILFPILSFAGDFKIAWDANPEPDISYYELSWGATSGVYPNSGTTTETSLTIPNLQDSITYYAVVVAYNTSGLRSPNSQELWFTFDEAKSNIPAEKRSPVTLSLAEGGVEFSPPNFEMASNVKRTVMVSENLVDWVELTKIQFLTLEAVFVPDVKLKRRFYKIIFN